MNWDLKMEFLSKTYEDPLAVKLKQNDVVRHDFWRYKKGVEMMFLILVGSDEK
jgi:tRNA A37 threonylcarbamoyladenosine dehydratase